SYRTSLIAARSVPPVLADIPVTPPAVKPSLYLHEGPQFLDEPRSLNSESALTSVQAILNRSEARYQAGKEHYDAGEFADAREDFDLAIETLLTAPANLVDRQRVERKLAELIETIHRFDLAGLGAGELPAEPVFDKSPIEAIPEPTFPIDPALANQVTEEVRVTASQLPLELTDEVLQYIKYFSSERGRKIVASGLRRAGRYRSLIQRILDEEGVPQELIHLAQAESGFMPRAVSRMRATGMWQFVLDTGRKYGLQQTRNSDDRLDPEKATRAAARHLRDLYQQFGDWYLAMAAYNCGPLNVERAVQRSGYADFWELRRLRMLPRESSNYIPIIVAMAIMSKNPAHYGLDGVEPDPAIEYSTIETEAPTHLALIADILGSPVSELLDLNPALLRNVAPEGYSLRVPKDKAASVSSALEMVPREQRAAWRLHRVEEGETLAGIAKRYSATAKGITEVNDLDDNPPEAGNLLLIPAAKQEAKVLKKKGTRTVARRSKRSGTRKASTRMASTASAKAKRLTKIASRSPRRRGTTVNR
ncbi:MAG: transglycosylase SLT domain-containing protein, partial [Bryobacteraceae bacterium]